MNVIIKIAEIDNELKYPCVMKSRQHDFLVLFVEERTGIYLSGTYTGSRQDNFISAMDEKMWERLPIGSEIILSNGNMECKIK